MVCDKVLFGIILILFLFVGWFFGVLGGGVLFDKIGRKLIMFVFFVLCSFFVLLVVFLNVFWFFMLFRFFVGICIGKCNVLFFFR